MKPLPKSMREDYRYLAIEIGAEIDREKAFNIIHDSVKSYAGDKGLVNIDPKIIHSESDYENSLIIVRINSKFEESFRAAIVLSETKMCTANVSGSSSSV